MFQPRFLFWWQGCGLAHSNSNLHSFSQLHLLLFFLPKTNFSSFFLVSSPSSPSTPSLHSLSLSLYSTSAPSHHVNYTTVLFLYYSAPLLFLSHSLLCRLLLRCQHFARVCSGCWNEEGACTGAQFNNKWLFSVIWLAQIRGLLVVLRRWLSQKIKPLHCCCLSTADWAVCLRCDILRY